PVAELKDYIGKELGHSEWLTVDQQRVDQFADCTGDHQFIHVDPEKAAQTPFGGTIAHGFLSLSLLPMLMGDLLVVPQGTRMGVNYGLDSLRFIQPVRVGSRVRLAVTLLDAYEKNPGQWLLKARAVMEIEGKEKPAYVAETLALCYLSGVGPFDYGILRSSCPPEDRMRLLYLLFLACLLTACGEGEPLTPPDAILPDGGRYRGVIVDGLLQGQGRLDYPNGASYQGAFKDGQWHGQGLWLGPTGDRYEGEFSNGLFQGQGRFSFADGGSFEGEFRQGSLNGQGSYRQQGMNYQGAFRDGLYHGSGILRQEDGVVHHGQFVK